MKYSIVADMQKRTDELYHALFAIKVVMSRSKALDKKDQLYPLSFDYSTFEKYLDEAMHGVANLSGPLDSWMEWYENLYSESYEP